jgi:hypothetical protein
MSDSVSRQAGFVGVQDTNKIDVSRQAGFVGTRDSNHEYLSRQAAFIAVRDSNHIYISRQAVFIGIRPNPVPYPPAYQFRPTGYRAALEVIDYPMMSRRKIGVVNKIVTTFTCTIT